MNKPSKKKPKSVSASVPDVELSTTKKPVMGFLHNQRFKCAVKEFIQRSGFWNSYLSPLGTLGS